MTRPANSSRAGHAAASWQEFTSKNGSAYNVARMTTATSVTALDKLCVDAIRVLAMDAVQKANSGHPGTPMALAPIAYTLYTRVMNHNPADPQWPDRDRFVLSCGHASMLLYSVVDHHTYFICSDGDLEEGVSGEASSVAGHLGLGRLIGFYDDNHISIEGDTKLAFSEDAGARYEAYGWHVQNLHEV